MTNPAPSKWAWQNALLADAQLPANARLVGMLLVNAAWGGTTVVFLDNETLAAQAGLARSTVILARRRLIDDGWLIEHTPARQHETTIYRMTTPQEEPSLTNQRTAQITYTDGVTEEFHGHRAELIDGLLVIIATNSAGADTDVRRFPLHNVRQWRWKDGLP